MNKNYLRTLYSEYLGQGSSIQWKKRKLRNVFLSPWELQTLKHGSQARVLPSLFGFRWATTEKSVRLWESLCIKDSLAVFLLVARVSQLSCCSISLSCYACIRIAVARANLRCLSLNSFQLLNILLVIGIPLLL